MFNFEHLTETINEISDKNVVVKNSDIKLEETYMYSVDTSDLKVLYDEFITIKGSKKFNLEMIEKIIENSKIAKKFKNELRVIFGNPEKYNVWFGVKNNNILGFMIGRFFSKIRDLLPIIGDMDDMGNMVKGFFDNYTMKLFIVLSNNSSFFGNFDDDEITKLIFHEITHYFSSSKPEMFNKQYSNVLLSYYENMFAKLMEQIVVNTLKKNKGLAHDDKELRLYAEKYNSDILVKNSNDRIKNTIRSIFLKAFKTFEWDVKNFSLKQGIDYANYLYDKSSILFNEYFKIYNSDELENENLYVEMNKDFKNALYKPVMIYFSGSLGIVKYLTTTELGRIMFKSLYYGYVKYMRTKYGIKKPRDSKSLYIQELFFPSEVICILNQTYPDILEKNIREELNHIIKLK